MIFKVLVDEYVDILCVTKTKTDISFPIVQVSLHGYHEPYLSSDRRGGLIVFIKSHLSSRRVTNYTTLNDIQITLFKINLRKSGCLCGVYL